MQEKHQKRTSIVKISKLTLLSLVVTKIKGKILFLKKIEEGKKILNRARLAKSDTVYEILPN